MRKSIFYYLFGLGKVLRSNRATLEEEGILLIDEGVPASLTRYHFRGPGRFSTWRKECYAGALVLTKTRIYANSHRSVVLDLPLTEAWIQKIAISGDHKKLDITFDASDFLAAKGRLRLRFKTPQGQRFLEALQPLLEASGRTDPDGTSS